MQKLGINDLPTLVKFAIRHELISGEREKLQSEIIDLCARTFSSFFPVSIKLV
jgi:hypothetical protein